MSFCSEYKTGVLMKKEKSAKFLKLSKMIEKKLTNKSKSFNLTNKFNQMV